LNYARMAAIVTTSYRACEGGYFPGPRRLRRRHSFVGDVARAD